MGHLFYGVGSCAVELKRYVHKSEDCQISRLCLNSIDTGAMLQRKGKSRVKLVLENMLD